MDYKPSARSPHYGRIFAYDINGKELQSVDLLEVIVVHNGKEYKVGKLLELSLKLEAGEKEMLAALKGLDAKQKELDEKIRLIAKILELQNVASNSDTIL